MSADLSKDDFSRLSDAEIFQAIEAFTRISEPIQVRPREGFVLDFKEEWGDRSLRTIAAFAHTFGGLLIVGVSERDAQPDQLIGIESVGELKTSIASSIATNISPPPLYEIAECSLPSAPTRKFAVIRVRQGHQIHYLTKKGEKPIYVRNEDESVPADAARLRSLIERRTSSSPSKAEVSDRIGGLRSSVQLHGQGGLAPQVEIFLVPFEHPGVILDSVEEQHFRRLIHRNFSFRYRDSVYDAQNDRGASWYQHCWLRPADNQQSVWRITSDGDVGYARHIRETPGESAKPFWSLGDVVADILLLLAVVRSWWKNAGFYGEAQLAVTLLLGDLLLCKELVTELSPNSPGKWTQMFNFNPMLSNAVVSPALRPLTAGGATGIFNSGLPYDQVTEMVAGVLNQVLRSIGHSADLSALTSAVEIFLDAYGS